MPLLVTYQGRPVKHRRRVPGGLLLVFVHPTRGQPGRTAVVSQDQWLRWGTTQFFPTGQMPDVRALAAQFENGFFSDQLSQGRPS